MTWGMFVVISLGLLWCAALKWGSLWAEGAIVFCFVLALCKVLTGW